MKQLQIIKEEFDTNTSEIERLEALYGFKLPVDYKDFLLKNNGCVIYPNYPTISNEKNYDLFSLERFLSVGDIILQKQHPLYFTNYNDQSEGGELNKLNKDHHLIFAFTDRGGMYFFDLSPENFGQIYYGHHCGTMVKINTNSFTSFINSFDHYPSQSDTIDQNYVFKLHYSQYKIFQNDLFYTPHKPELGLQRFKEVFEINGDFQPTENGYPNVPQKYVNDKSKLDFLLSMGCSKLGLLNYAKDAHIVKYLIQDIGLDINEPYKGRFPLQNFLTPGSGNDCNIKYKLMDELLGMDLEMDWDIQGKLWNGERDLTFIDKLQKLHYEYYKNEEGEKQWNGNSFVPYKRSELIEKKLESNSNSI